MPITQETLNLDHRRLAYLADKNEPTRQDISEAKEIIFRTQMDVSVKTNQAERDYAAMHGRYSWTMDKPTSHFEAWQGQSNGFNWAILCALMNVQTVAMDCEELAKKAEDYAAKVNARSTSAKCGSAQAKAGEAPKDEDSGWGFLLQW